MTLPVHSPSNLRLQVETAGAAVKNLFRQPYGDRGAWPFTPALMDVGLSLTTDGTNYIVARGTNSTWANDNTHSIYPHQLPVTPGAWLRLRLKVGSLSSGATLRWSVDWHSSSAYMSGTSLADMTIAGGIAMGGAIQVPTNASFVYIRVQVVGSPPTSFTFSEVVAATAATEAELAAVPMIEPVVWSSNLLGPTHHIEVERQDLDLGVLDATILDAALDPATSTQLQPGRALRLQALVGGTWENLFTGTLLDADVSYVGRGHKGIATRIALTAVDNVASLANDRNPYGYASIGRIANGLLHTVPFRVNGSGDLPSAAHLGRGSALVSNPDATQLDWVALTRDSAGGYAWVDRDGVLVINDAANMPTSRVARFLDTATSDADAALYGDVDLAFSTRDVINHVVVTWLRKVGETIEEITYGPYIDAASARRYGAKSKTFTITGLTEDAAAVESFARGVIAKHAAPVRKASRVVLPVKDLRSMRHATTLDLYDLVGVKRATLLDADYRITSIKHTIATDRWSVAYGFDTTGAVAPPAAQPAPARDNTEPTNTSARATSALATTTTATVIAGTTITVTSTRDTDVFEAIGVFDMQVTTGSAAVGVGQLQVNGAAQTGQALYQQPANGSRATVTQVWRVTGLAPGRHTFRLLGSKNSTAGAININAGHTALTVKKV